MGLIRELAQHVSALVSAKLGRCPKCMGLSLSGAVLGWLVFFGTLYFWPQFPFVNVLAAVPATFTALWVLHILTFGSRVVAAEKRAGHVPAPATGSVMTRRRVAVVFATGVGFAALASAVVPLRALGQGCGMRCCLASLNGADCCPHQFCHQLTPDATNHCGAIPSGGKTNGICMSAH